MDKKDVSGYAKEYKQLPFEDVQVQYRLKKIKEILGRFNHSSILEVGCGLHSIFESYQDFDQLTIVEPAKDFCEVARNSIANKDFDEKVKVVEGFVEESLPELSGENYDFILMSELLNEVENPNDVLKAVHSLCGKNTVVHINVTNAKSFHRLMGMEMGVITSSYDISDQQKKLKQKIVYDCESLKQLAKLNEFEVIEEGTYFVKPFSHQQMMDLVNSKILPDNFLDGLDKMVKYMPELGSEVYVNLKSKK